MIPPQWSVPLRRYHPPSIRAPTLLARSLPPTATVNSCALPAAKLALVGEISTLISGGGGGLKSAGVPAVPQPSTRIAIALR